GRPLPRSAGAPANSPTSWGTKLPLSPGSEARGEGPCRRSLRRREVGGKPKPASKGFSAASTPQEVRPARFVANVEGATRLYLEIHGARGSMPVGTGEFARHGGDTTCYSVHHDDGSLIAVVDAGTGLRLLYPRLDVPGATIPFL